MTRKNIQALLAAIALVCHFGVGFGYKLPALFIISIVIWPFILMVQYLTATEGDEENLPEPADLDYLMTILIPDMKETASELGYILTVGDYEHNNVQLIAIAIKTDVEFGTLGQKLMHIVESPAMVFDKIKLKGDLKKHCEISWKSEPEKYVTIDIFAEK